MKLGKKIGSAGLAVVLSAGLISAGGYARTANAAELSGTDSKCSYSLGSYECKTTTFLTKGVEDVYITITNTDTETVYFAIREQVKGFADVWQWSTDENAFDANISPWYTIRAGETKNLTVRTNASQTIFKNEVQGVYVVSDLDKKSHAGHLEVTYSGDRIWGE